jgi:hypothetical protein
MARQTLIQIRKGTAADWASSNPTLASGEMALVVDENKLAVGNGESDWQSLPKLRVDGGDLNA